MTAEQRSEQASITGNEEQDQSGHEIPDSGAQVRVRKPVSAVAGGGQLGYNTGPPSNKVSVVMAQGKRTGRATKKAAAGRAKSAAASGSKATAKVVKKSAARTAKKTPAKVAAKKAPGKSASRPAAKKNVVKKAPAKKVAARKPAVRKPATGKSAAAKKPTASKRSVATKRGKAAAPARQPAAARSTGKAPSSTRKSGSSSSVNTARSATRKRAVKGIKSRTVVPNTDADITMQDGHYALPATVHIELPQNYKPGADEEYMSPRQLEYFRRKLTQWREDLVEESRQTIESLRDEVRDVGDDAERATRETENSLELRTRDRYRKLIAKIDKALKRIEEGHYGYCEETDEEIGLDRLEARPIATMSLDAQERWEHRQKQMGD